MANNMDYERFVEENLGLNKTVGLKRSIHKQVFASTGGLSHTG